MENFKKIELEKINKKIKQKEKIIKQISKDINGFEKYQLINEYIDYIELMGIKNYILKESESDK